VDPKGEDRASRVYSRFQSARTRNIGLSSWRHLTFSEGGGVVGLCFVIPLVILEPGLWSDSWLSNWYALPDAVFLAILPLMLFQSWALSRYLSSRTASDGQLPRWHRFLRFLAASLPLAGLLAIPAWKAYLKKARVRATPLDLGTRCLRLPDGLGPYYGFISLYCLLFGVLFVFVFLALGLPGKFEPRGPWPRWVLLWICAVLHLSCSAVLSLSLHNDENGSVRSLGRWEPALRRAVPWLLLLSLPGVVIGTGLVFFLTLPSEKAVLLKAAYDRRYNASRLPIWPGVRQSLLRRWEGAPWFLRWRGPSVLHQQAPAGRADFQVASFHRLKTLGLLVEAGAFTWTLVHLTARIQGSPPRLDPVIRLVPWLGGTIGLGVLAFHVMGLAARLPRRHTYSRSLLWTQAAFLAGCLATLLRIEGRIFDLALLLCVGGMISVFLPIFAFGLWDWTGQKLNLRDVLLWGALGFTIFLLGLGIALSHGGPNAPLAFLEKAATFSPVYGPLLFLLLGRWLLRPFSGRHVFDRSLPRRFRAALALVILTAVLPLGGLAIPFWIYARHRIWPRYERMLPA
jgi:hypothetical protein